MHDQAELRDGVWLIVRRCLLRIFIGFSYLFEVIHNLFEKLLGWYQHWKWASKRVRFSTDLDRLSSFDLKHLPESEKTLPALYSTV
jgi:hypothetical protein